MKYFTWLLFFVTSIAYADTYYVKAERVNMGVDGGMIYETGGGVIIKTSPDCDAPLYEYIRLEYNNRPYLGAFGGVSYDEIFYTDTEYFIDDESIIDREIIKSCYVQGVIGLQPTNQPEVISTAIYNADDKTIELWNILVCENRYDCNKYYEYAKLIYIESNNTIQLNEFIE